VLLGYIKVYLKESLGRRNSKYRILFSIGDESPNYSSVNRGLPGTLAWKKYRKTDTFLKVSKKYTFLDFLQHFCRDSSSNILSNPPMSITKIVINKRK